MNKSWFQILLSAFVLGTVIAGLYVFYQNIFGQLVTVLSGRVPLTLTAVSFLVIIAFVLFLIITLFFAALQIFRTGDWCLFKYLLYASIPACNIFNYFIYTFYFMPTLYAIVTYKPAIHQLQFAVNTEILPIMFGFNFAVSTKPGDTLMLGINFIPIIVIILLQKFYRKA